MTTSPPSGGRRRPRRRWPKFLLAAIGAVLVFSGVGAGVWRYRFGLPPRVDPIAPSNALVAELSGDLAADSPDNALVHYRTLVVDVLGLPGADWDEIGANSPDSAIQAAWRASKPPSRVPRMFSWHSPALDQYKITIEVLRPLLDPLDRAADAEGFRPVYSPSGDIFEPDAVFDRINDDMLATQRRVMLGRPRQLNTAQMIARMNYDDWTVLPLPHLTVFRQLGELNAAHLRAAAHTDDWDELVRRVRTGLRHGRHVASEPFLVSARVGIAIEQVTLDELRLCLGTHDLPLATYDELLAELDSVGDVPSLARHMRGEAIALPGTARIMLAEEAQDIPPWTREYWQIRMATPPQSTLLRDARDYLTEMQRYVAKPYFERVALPPPDRKSASGLVGDYRVTLREYDQLCTSRAATRIFLLLERFRTANSRWPESLEEVMPRRETLDPSTQQPFVFTRTPDGPAPYTLHAPPETNPFIDVTDQDFTKSRGGLSSDRSAQ